MNIIQDSQQETSRSNDSVHEQISLHPLSNTIMKTWWFQRMHNIKQLSLAHLFYPCAKHARFEHSQGYVKVLSDK